MYIIKCKKCKGTGHVPLPLGGGMKANARCPVCNGRKELIIPDGKQLCPDCDGSGDIKVKFAGLTHIEPCETCDGTGFVDK